MRTAIRAGVVAGLLLLTACGKSEAEIQADCEKALDKTSTKTNRPDACKELSQEDYDTLLMAWVMQTPDDRLAEGGATARVGTPSPVELRVA
ncbi:hypothetical protein [Streptomyces sp. 2A115]|uniref:hypothetical protein n=1 Tax=Streptomyces sp. 2A115 TaxID=3457439 RepID=UPI003FD42818